MATVDSLRGLVGIQHSTKHALSQTLSILKDQGLLDEGVTARQLKEASEHHATQRTHYGNVIQKLEINAPGMKYLDVVNPFAMMEYLCTISAAFANMMRDVCSSGKPLSLVIYADEMNPGNPFRPEKSRMLQCVYWAFAEWPAHVLSRTFAWPVLLLLRSSIVESFNGGMSYICRLLLRLFSLTSHAPRLRLASICLTEMEPLSAQVSLKAFCATSRGTRKIQNGKGIMGIFVVLPA